MIMDASSKVAVKCSECGKYSLINLNFFHLKIPTSIRCECGHRMLKAQVKKLHLVLEIDCIACEKPHTYKFKLKDVMERATNIISCPVTGMEIAFLGKDDYVDGIIERYNNDMKEILKSFGVIENIAKKIVK
jgi:DNA-directed RNA polymerase subunit RPC12/RpoP